MIQPIHRACWGEQLFERKRKILVAEISKFRLLFPFSSTIGTMLNDSPRFIASRGTIDISDWLPGTLFIAHLAHLNERPSQSAGFQTGSNRGSRASPNQACAKGRPVVDRCFCPWSSRASGGPSAKECVSLDN